MDRTSSAAVAARLSELASDLRRGELTEVAAPRRGWKSGRLGATGVVLLVFVAVAVILDRSVEAVALQRRIDAAAHELASLVNRYRQETGLYPDIAMWQHWVESSDDSRFLDPWQRPYLYRFDARGFSIATYGADGQAGGTGADRDLLFSFRDGNASAASIARHSDSQGQEGTP